MSNIDSRPSYSNAREYAILASAEYYEEFKNRKRGTVSFDHMAHRPYGIGATGIREDRYVR